MNIFDTLGLDGRNVLKSSRFLEVYQYNVSIDNMGTDSITVKKSILETLCLSKISKCHPYPPGYSAKSISFNFIDAQ